MGCMDLQFHLEAFEFMMILSFICEQKIDHASPSLHLVAFSQLCTSQNSLHALSLFMCIEQFRRLQAWVQYFYHVLWPGPYLLLDMKTQVIV